MGLFVLLAAAAAVIIAVGTLWLIRMIRRPPRHTLASALARGFPAEPSELKLDAQDVTLRLPDETTTPAWLIEGEQSAGPIVVVSHGWASGRYVSLARAPLLTPHASRVVLYDLRGHGDSTARNCDLGAREVDDLLAVIEQVTPTDQADTPVVLYGSSMGGVISMHAAARDEAKRIVGVVAEAPYLQLGTPMRGQLRRREAPTWPFAPLALAHFRFWIKGFAAFDLAIPLDHVACPLLVLHGTDDAISPHAHGRQIADDAPHGELVAFEGAGHSRLHEHDPHHYESALRAFFERAAAASNDTPLRPVAVERSEKPPLPWGEGSAQ